MARKGKRSREELEDAAAATLGSSGKRSKKSAQALSHRAKTEHPVLSQLYDNVQKLRDYVLEKLPHTSRIRRKKVAAIGSKGPVSEDEKLVAELLDTVLIGHQRADSRLNEDKDRWEQWATFSQRGDDSHVTITDIAGGSLYSQSEIVDFVIWSLFEKSRKTSTWPKHILCDGFRKNWGVGHQRQHPGQGRELPGIISVAPNPYVEQLKQAPWTQLLRLLGKSGERIMIDLLLDCAMFMPVSAGEQNFCQISGVPLSELKQGSSERKQPNRAAGILTAAPDITFARYRMLYARAALNARGRVHFGLRHIHVLNRSRLQGLGDEDAEDEEKSTQIAMQNSANTTRVLMYMFPRQFGLHNVFTSKVDFRETSQRFKDYTLREEEISFKFGKDDNRNRRMKIPKRLRGRATELVQQLQKRHQKCSYSKLMEHYCPVFGVSEPQRESTARGKTHSQARSQPLKMCDTSKPVSLVDLANHPTQIFAFCRAVLLKVIPQGFWGVDANGEQNRDHFVRKVYHFITLRRLESMTLDEVLQGMKITNVDWLASAELLAHKMSQSDIQKRIELFSEFIYFAVDSILIPLIRSNFYVTESSSHRYRLFFFRHDVWRSIAEPAMAGLKSDMLEEVKLGDARQILDARALGFSQIRLLPKAAGMRAISNLRRRTVKQRGRKELGPAINKILAPAHAVLKLERSANEDKLGSSLFAVGDIYTRLHAFKNSLQRGAGQFYFAKVDVQGAFDTIPQAAIVGLLASIPQHKQYRILRHLEVSPGVLDANRLQKSKLFRRWNISARTAQDKTTFVDSLEAGSAKHQRNSVFVDTFYKKQYETPELLKLVSSHVQDNLVKVGKKYYRQKRGIPQGSILSAILCNYFYADLEAQVLGFLKDKDCLLLRLIDDFLLVTTDQSKAARFIEIMHRGVPDYGVTVNPSKTLVNFDLVVNNHKVAQMQAQNYFPYCGTLIDTESLNVSRARDKDSNNKHAIYDSLTVEYSRLPGQSFQRKILNAFKIQAHLLYYDTNLNSASTSLKNISAAFTEVATKMWAYTRSLPPLKQPRASLIISTITKLISQGYRLLVGKRRKTRYPGYVCDIARAEVQWLAYSAFQRVLGQRQTNYGGVLKWLEDEVRVLGGQRKIRLGRVGRIEPGVYT